MARVTGLLFKGEWWATEATRTGEDTAPPDYLTLLSLSRAPSLRLTLSGAAFALRLRGRPAVLIRGLAPGPLGLRPVLPVRAEARWESVWQAERGLHESEPEER